MNMIWKKYSFAIILIFTTLLMGLYIIFSTSESEDQYIMVTVKQGETLWNISEKHAKQLGFTTADFVKILEKENKLANKILIVGEQIKIPTPFKYLDDHGQQFVLHSELGSESK